MPQVNDNVYVLIAIGVVGGLLLAGSVVYFIVLYIRKINRQREELQKIELAHQSQLFTAVIESQEEERRKIGREMHDEVGSTLAAIRLNLSSQSLRKGTDAKTQENIRSLDKLSGIVRNISHLLSPPDLEYGGFHEALENLCASFETDNVTIILEDHAQETIPADRFNTALSLYRIFQELLTNTIRHSGATQIHIQLRNEGTTFIASYSDNGRGFDTSDLQKNGLGLQSIQSRVLMIQATIQLESQPGKGFRCTISLEHEHI